MTLHSRWKEARSVKKCLQLLLEDDTWQCSLDRHRQNCYMSMKQRQEMCGRRRLTRLIADNVILLISVFVRLVYFWRCLKSHGLPQVRYSKTTSSMIDIWEATVARFAIDIKSRWREVGCGDQLPPSGWPHNIATGLWPSTTVVVSSGSFLHCTGHYGVCRKKWPSTDSGLCSCGLCPLAGLRLAPNILHWMPFLSQPSKFIWAWNQCTVCWI